MILVYINWYWKFYRDYIQLIRIRSSPSLLFVFILFTQLNSRYSAGFELGLVD